LIALKTNPERLYKTTASAHWKELCHFTPSKLPVNPSQMPASTTPISTSDRKTRASNIDKHLGLPDLPNKRRSPKEKTADEQKLTDLHTAKEATVAQAIQKMGEMENKMANDQAAAITAAKPVRPHAKTTKNGPKETEGKCIV
jgi:hypothetical protein